MRDGTGQAGPAGSLHRRYEAHRVPNFRYRTFDVELKLDVNNVPRSWIAAGDSWLSIFEPLSGSGWAPGPGDRSGDGLSLDKTLRRSEKDEDVTCCFVQMPLVSYALPPPADGLSQHPGR